MTDFKTKVALRKKSTTVGRRVCGDVSSGAVCVHPRGITCFWRGMILQWCVAGRRLHDDSALGVTAVQGFLRYHIYVIKSVPERSFPNIQYTKKRKIDCEPHKATSSMYRISSGSSRGGRCQILCRVAACSFNLPTTPGEASAMWQASPRKPIFSGVLRPSSNKDSFAVGENSGMLD